MRVQQILNSKGDTSVATVAPGSPVEAAVKMLAEKRIGAVVVSPDGTTVAGILSERDVVREIGRRGAGCLTGLVDDFMTRDPVTCALEDDSDDVFRKMTSGRFRHLPVVKDGAMVGLISIGDVVKARLSELAMEKDALEGMIMGF